MTGSIQSQAQFTFCYDATRKQTWLSQRITGGLCHISKPYWDGLVLITQVINPTAGLFAGDVLKLEVKLEAGSHVALTSPSATRFHSMDSEKAMVDQLFMVESKAFLEFLPDWSIPQKDSEVEQTTRIDVKKEGSCVFVERFMPGRIAHGEAYTFRSFIARTKLFYADEIVVHERMHLLGENHGWPLAVPEWDVCYYGAMWLVLDDLKKYAKHAYELENLLTSDQIHCGVTMMNDNVMVVRLMVARSVLMQSCIVRARKHLSFIFPQLAGASRVTSAS